MRSPKLSAKIGGGAAATLLVMVMGFEGYAPVVTGDPIDRSVVCWGHDDPGLIRGTFYTEDRCRDILDADLLEHAEALECFDIPLTDSQKAAIVSWAYNVGVNAVCGSTLVRMANAGMVVGTWCGQLHRWVYAGGKKFQGLVNRRQKEYELCVAPETIDV